MKKIPSTGERIKSLRTARGETQTQFADLLGVTQPMISAWEAAWVMPSSETYLRLGNLAGYPECIWFWQEAGLDMEAHVSAAEKELKKRGAAPAQGEIVRVPFMEETPQGWKATGSELPLPAELVPNPGSTFCFIVDEKSAGYAFAAGEIVVIEPAGDQKDPRPFWGQVVLCDFALRSEQGNRRARETWPEGLFMGRLRLKKYAHTDLLWFAELGAFSESEPSPNTFLHRFPGSPIAIGSWEHPRPSEEPIKGSERARLQEKVKKADAYHEELRDKEIARCPVFTITVAMEKAAKVRSEAMGELIAAKEREKEEAKREAKEQAPANVRLYEGCRILGLAITWFHPLKPGRK